MHPVKMDLLPSVAVEDKHQSINFIVTNYGWQQ